MRSGTLIHGNALRPSSRTPRLGAVVVFGLLWWIISEGELASWLYGVPAVALAVHVTARSAGWPLTRFRLWPLLQLSAAFLWWSVRGGIDVARRVLGRELGIRPVVVSYDWRLPEGELRTLMLAMINLQPGTLGVWSDEHSLQVHLLHEGLSLAKDLGRLEDQVAGLVGRELRAATGRES